MLSDRPNLKCVVWIVLAQYIFCWLQLLLKTGYLVGDYDDDDDDDDDGDDSGDGDDDDDGDDSEENEFLETELSSARD